MSDRASSPILTSSGQAHPQLQNCVANSLKYCSRLGVGSALLLSCLQGQISHNAQIRGGTISAHPSDIDMPLAAAQTLDVHLAFGGNRPQGHGPKYSPLWQHRPTPHGPRWHHTVLTSGYCSRPSSLQFWLSSFCPYPLVSLSLPFLHDFLAPLSGAWGHLRSARPSSRIMLWAGVISGMV